MEIGGSPTTNIANKIRSYSIQILLGSIRKDPQTSSPAAGTDSGGSFQKHSWKSKIQIPSRETETQEAGQRSAIQPNGYVKKWLRKTKFLFVLAFRPMQWTCITFLSHCCLRRRKARTPEVQAQNFSNSQSEVWTSCGKRAHDSESELMSAFEFSRARTILRPARLPFARGQERWSFKLTHSKWKRSKQIWRLWNSIFRLAPASMNSSQTLSRKCSRLSNVLALSSKAIVRDTGQVIFSIALRQSTGLYARLPLKAKPSKEEWVARMSAMCSGPGPKHCIIFPYAHVSMSLIRDQLNVLFCVLFARSWRETPTVDAKPQAQSDAIRPSRRACKTVEVLAFPRNDWIIICKSRKIDDKHMRSAFTRRQVTRSNTRFVLVKCPRFSTQNGDVPGDIRPQANTHCDACASGMNDQKNI